MAIFIFAVCITKSCSFSSDCGLRDWPSVVEIELKMAVREPVYLQFRWTLVSLFTY